jgi:hypothetical protein
MLVDQNGYKKDSILNIIQIRDTSSSFIIVIENANLRFPKCKFDIMEKYKPLITQWFVSLIGYKTSLQLINILRDTGVFQT